MQLEHGTYTMTFSISKKRTPIPLGVVHTTKDNYCNALPLTENSGLQHEQMAKSCLFPTCFQPQISG